MATGGSWASPLGLLLPTQEKESNDYRTWLGSIAKLMEGQNGHTCLSSPSAFVVVMAKRPINSSNFSACVKEGKQHYTASAKTKILGSWCRLKLIPLFSKPPWSPWQPPLITTHAPPWQTSGFIISHYPTLERKNNVKPVKVLNNDQKLVANLFQIWMHFWFYLLKKRDTWYMLIYIPIWNFRREKKNTRQPYGDRTVALSRFALDTLGSLIESINLTDLGVAFIFQGGNPVVTFVG